MSINFGSFFISSSRGAHVSSNKANTVSYGVFKYICEMRFKIVIFKITKIRDVLQSGTYTEFILFQMKNVYC